MLIAARNGFMVGGGRKNPYITDGLVAMWDGEWNAGGGKHESAPAQIKDIIGGFGDATITADTQIGADWFGISSGPSVVGATVSFTPSKYKDVVFAELVCSVEDVNHHWTNQISVVSSTFCQAYPNWTYLSLSSDTVDNGSQYSAPAKVLEVAISNGPQSISASVGRAVASDSNAERLAKNVFYANGSLATASFANALYQKQGKIYFGYCTSSAQAGYVCKTHRLSLYNRILTADEIAANYAVDKARFNLP